MLKFVIGERLSNVNLSSNYITFKNYLEEVNSAAFKSRVYIPAQGLTDAERRTVYQDNVQYLSDGRYKAGALQTKEAMHKREEKNVLITELLAVEHGHYESNLVIHNDNELILDHFSGSHIPGMVFLEATRQLSIAAWAKYENAEPEQAAMIINDISCEYKKFAFIFCVDIDVKINKVTENSYKMDIEFIQNGSLVVRSFGSFQVAAKDKVASLEASMMKKMTNARTKYFLSKENRTLA